MKNKEELAKWRSATVKDLQKTLATKHKEYTKLRLESGFGRNTKTSEFSRLKKEIAQINTLINEMILTSANLSIKEVKNG